jgi:hypothetical protein
VNTISELDVGAEADCVRFAVLQWAAEFRRSSEHVVDADLLRNALMDIY